MENMMERIIVYGLFSIGFCGLLFILYKAISVGINQVFSGMRKDDSLEKASLKSRINKSGKELERARAMKAEADKRQAEKETRLVSEIDRLIQKGQAYEALLQEKSSEEKLLEQAATENTQRKSPGMKRVPLASFMQDIFDQVYAKDEQDVLSLFKAAIREYDVQLANEEIKAALPYKLLLRLFTLYKGEQMENFAASFRIFMKEIENLEMKKLYQGVYFSPEQKLKIMNEKGLLDDLDEEFISFAFYLLANISYRKLKGLYQRFEKSYKVRYLSKPLVVDVVDSESQEIFEALWLEAHSEFPLKFNHNKGMQGGAILYHPSFTVDMSYLQLVKAQTENIEVEVKI